MPKFFYIARNTKGHKISGAEDGFNQEEIINRLQANGLYIVSIMREDEKGAVDPSLIGLKKGKFKFRHYGVGNEDLVLFCRQLATLLGAGVTILKSLQIISLQVSSTRLYNILKKLQKDMEAGLSLHEAMARHPAVFSELWVNLVESGEASGNLAMVLSRLAGYLERNQAFKNKLISAMVYPVILLIAGVGALLFLTIKIIPTFADLFKGFSVELPALTKMLITVSYFIRTKFLIILAVFLIAGFLIKDYLKTKTGRRNFENLLFNLPMFGDFFRALAVERFSSEMSTLVESGVPLLYSLEIAEHSVANLVMADIIHKIKEEVRSGRSLSQPLERSGFFDPIVVQMVAIGEEIGELPQMFKKLNSFYQEFVETNLVRFSTVFEPVMLIFMGAVIGIMVIGIFLPIFQIAQIGG